MRNSQISVRKTNFFPIQPIAKFLFLLHSNYTGDTPYQVWLYLDIAFNRWKTPIFEILHSQFFRNNRKFPYENPTFFLGKLCQKFLLLYTLITMVILDTKFGLIWTLSSPDEKELFFKFAIHKNSLFLKFTSYNGISSSPTLYLHRGYSIPSLVWFEHLLETMKRAYFRNSIIAVHSKQS